MSKRKGWTEDIYPHGDVKVYPEVFPDRGHVNWTDYEEFSAERAWISVGQGKTSKGEEGGMVIDGEYISIAVRKTGTQDELATIEMHPKDAEKLMEPLVYTFAGMEGIKAINLAMGREVPEDLPIFRLKRPGILEDEEGSK